MTPRDTLQIRQRLYLGVRTVVLCAVLATPFTSRADPPTPSCALPAARVAQTGQTLPSTGQIHGLVLFGTFADDTGRGTSGPAWADSLFRADLPGSLSHFFDEMSHGQYQMTGAAAPGMYRSRHEATVYTAAVLGQATGDFGRFVEEIIDAADADIDFGAFDNDGPDGEPNSGDDDGYVDALYVVLPEMPTGFLVSDANGLAVLGLSTPVSTDDLDPNGARIRIRQDVAPGAAAGGTIQEGRSFAGTVGIIAHEHGHLLGLPDLFDTGFLQGADSGPAEDSAGIGYWGLMGHGARGWGDLGGPTPFCAWSLAQLGWLGIDNSALRAVDITRRDVRLEDTNADGFVYRLPILGRQYLLVEHRRADVCFYDRHLPADGVLIWHVNESVSSNNTEATKIVDLVCADGRFADAGYPEGAEPAPADGDDNLDFWAHDATYRSAHAGNLGDATDVFDGQQFTQFTPVTNPASRNVAVERIRRDGESMVVDLIVGDRRKAGVLVENETWSGSVDVVADVEVPEGIGLRIAAGTTVRFFPDARRSGRDPERSELQVEGILSVGGGATTTLTSGADVPAPGDWSGIRVLKTGEIRLIDVVVEYAQDAVRIVDATRAVLFEDVEIRSGSGDGVHLSADDAGHDFTRVTVEDVAGTGMLLTGEAPVFLEGVTIRRCGGPGLHRALGVMQCSDGAFTDNGQQLSAAVNILLEDGVFGTLSGNTVRGGTGLQVIDIGQLQIEDNLFRDTQVAIHHRTGRSWIVANTIAGADTAFRIEGATTPERFELNRLSDVRIVVDNRSAADVFALRNWWGTSDVTSIEARLRGSVLFEPFLNFDPLSPITFNIGPVFPNPSIGMVNIPYTVGIGDVSVGGEASRTIVNVRNVLGGFVRRLVAEVSVPGIYSAQWDGRDAQGRMAAAGLYFAEFDVGGIRLYTALLRLR